MTKAERIVLRSVHEALEDAIPFIGYGASVPDLVERAEDALRDLGDLLKVEPSHKDKKALS